MIKTTKTNTQITGNIQTQHQRMKPDLLGMSVVWGKVFIRPIIPDVFIETGNGFDQQTFLILGGLNQYAKRNFPCILRTFGGRGLRQL